MAWILMKQVAVLFLLMGIGIFFEKKQLITEKGAKMMSNLVLMLVIPTVIIESFQQKLEKTMLAAVGTAFVLAVLFHVMAVVVTKFILRPRNDNQYPVERLLAICSNCGFMGIPLMTAVMGEVGLLYAAVYIAVFNLYTWTHGVLILRRSKTINWREVFCTPGMIGVFVGITLYLCQIRLPELLAQTVTYIADMNTPLPTIVTGIFIAEIDLKKALSNKRIYFAAALRLIILPLIFIALLWVLRVPLWFEQASTAALAMVICCSCSGAITTSMLPARYGGDANHGAALVAVTTLFSIVTIPGIATIAQLMLT